MLKMKIEVNFESGMVSEWEVELGTEVRVHDNDLYLDGIKVARHVDFIKKEEVRVIREYGLN